MNATNITFSYLRYIILLVETAGNGGMNAVTDSNRIHY